jgi:cell division protein FtsB
MIGLKPIVILLLILLALLQYKLWLGEGSIPEIWELKETLVRQRHKNQQLRERNLVLDAEVRDLKEGLEAVEERARLELGMIKEGEVFFQVVEPITDKHEVPE